MSDDRLMEYFPDLPSEVQMLYQSMISALGIKQSFDEEDLKAITKLPTMQEIMPHLQQLLNKGLIKLLESYSAKEGKKTLSFQPILLDEALKLTKMSPDEAMIYNYISASGREGIWTKTIKAKTNLHQHVVSRCLKNLENQSAIKVIKSVKFPQRKIYMLYNLTPSIEVTGGPWFTDSELDVDFISSLLLIVWKFVANSSYPVVKDRKNIDDRLKQCNYINNAEFQLPNLKDIVNFISNSKVTDVELNASDVKSLCDVLEYEEQIEKLKNGSYKATWQSVLERLNINNKNDDVDPVFNIGDEFKTLQQKDDKRDEIYLDSWISM